MTTMQRPRHRVTITSLLVLAAAAFLILANRQGVYDFLRTYNYSPPTAIAQLATDDTMTDQARHIYYVNHPMQEGRTTFSAHCPSGTEQSVVLGCYRSNQDGIYLLQVTNTELAGIEQVTAAHEMLHAGYDRLSPDKRKQVDAMLQDYYDHGLTDMTVKQTIAAYQKTEPGELVNEMHSILGTEVAHLPVGLEDYYKQYFTDRTKVTDYYTRYQAAFSSRQAQVKQDDTMLHAMKNRITSLQSGLPTRLANLQAQRTGLQSERGSDSATYNNVRNYNQSVDSYNADVDTLRGLISQYNQLVAARNALALEEQQLVEAITSTPAKAQ